MLRGMLHGSETWPIRKKTEVALQRQRREWLDGFVMLGYKSSKERVERETRIR